MQRFIRHCFKTTVISTVLILGFHSAIQAEESQEGPAPSLTLEIPMRDGVQLPTDIYLPEGKCLDLPTILIRTPAGKRSYAQVFAPLAQAGYLVAIQDTRSSLDSEGKTMPLTTDGWGEKQDGYDTVQWLAEHPLTNGKIGTLGFSIMGITQLLMAPSQPPNLCCQYIGVAAGCMYKHAMFNGGCLLKHQVESWIGYYAPHPSVLSHVTSQVEYNDFWESLNTIDVSEQVQVPAIFYTGWYDVFLQGTIDAFRSRQERGGEGARGQQKLIIGPWTHYWPLKKGLADVNLPEHALYPPVDISPLRWFDHHLKGAENGVNEIAPITYYVMGPFDGSASSGNRWKTADQWPIPSTETPLYLSKENSLQKASLKEYQRLTYAYDPEDPTPTVGGNNLFLESGPKDQSIIEERDDVIIFTSEPLEEDLEVTGQVIAQLFFSTNRSQSDLAIRLTDVYPDGKSLLIADGMCCTSHAKRPSSPIDIYSKPPLEMEVNLETISMVFAKGHRIRIIVSSSNYPRFEKNLNPSSEMEGSSQIAKNTLHFGGPYSSKIILPVVKANDPIVAKE